MKKDMQATAKEVMAELKVLLNSEKFVKRMVGVSHATMQGMRKRKEWDAAFFAREFLLIQRKQSKQPANIRNIIMRTVNSAIKNICQRKEAS